MNIYTSSFGSSVRFWGGSSTVVVGRTLDLFWWRGGAGPDPYSCVPAGFLNPLMEVHVVPGSSFRHFVHPRCTWRCVRGCLASVVLITHMKCISSFRQPKRQPPCLILKIKTRSVAIKSCEWFSWKLWLPKIQLYYFLEMICNAKIYFHKFKLIDYLHYLLSLQRFVVPAWALQPLSSPKKNDN